MTTARGHLANNSRRFALRLFLALACGATSTTVALNAQGRQPALSVLTPTQAQEISGQISFWAAIDFGAGIVSLRFQVDGKDHGQPITPGLNRVTWDSTKATDGLHTVQAIGQDRFGNTVVSQPVTFFVNNFAPTQQTPARTAPATPLPPPEPSRQPMPIATPAPAPAPRPKQDFGSDDRTERAMRPVAVACKDPDPFKTKGGIGLCVAGEWVLLWKPGKKN